MIELTRRTPKTEGQSRAPDHPNGRSRWWRTLRNNAPRFAMAAPAVVWVFIFSYIPMFGLIIAFKDYRAADGMWGSAWVGLRNFRFLFSTQDGVRMLVNTLIMNGLFIVVDLVASLAVAMLLYKIQHHVLARLFQAGLFFPYFMSWVIVGVFVFALLSTDTGLINELLALWGFEPVRWYSSPQYWRAILTIVNLWKGIGWWSVIYLAGLMAINPEYYEAAEVDGANAWQRTWYVTLPLLVPLITITTLLRIGRVLYADFGLFYQVTRDSGLLYETTDVVDTYVYRALTRTGDVGMASAAGFYQAVVGFILVLASNLIVKRIDSEKSLF